MEVEQRYVIKFFSDGDMSEVQIVARFRQHYGEGVLSRTEVYFWINEVTQWRTDLNTVASSGKEANEVLLLLLLASSMQILTFQPGSLHSPWGLQPQRFVDT
jgi:hypothetical protein